MAEGDVIFSLDDDAVFSSRFVVEQTLRDFSHPRIGAVAIPYIEPHKANKEMQRAPTREDVWITASYIGTAHAVRRDVFLALGGYREHLVHQGEEGAFCIRMLAAEKPIADGGGLKANSAEGVKALDSGPSPLDSSSPATSNALPATAPQALKGLVVGRLQNYKGADLLCKALRLVPGIEIEWVGGDTDWGSTGLKASEYLAANYPDVFGKKLHIILQVIIPTFLTNSGLSNLKKNLLKNGSTEKTVYRS